MNSKPTTVFSHFCTVCIFPYTVPMRCALNARIHAITSTGSAVAKAKTTGSSQPAVVVADIGISMPK